MFLIDWIVSRGETRDQTTIIPVARQDQQVPLSEIPSVCPPSLVVLSLEHPQPVL